MNQLLALGVTLLLNGTSYDVFAPAPGTATLTCADLIAAGIADASCTAQLIACPTHLSERAHTLLTTVGLPTERAGQRYVHGQTLALVWTGSVAGGWAGSDGGIVWHDAIKPGVEVPMLLTLGVTERGDPNLQVMDYTACMLSTCDGLCTAAVPLRWVQPPCVRQRADAGLTCLRQTFTGWVDSGDGNVFPRTQAVDPATCQPVSCSVWDGNDNPEVTL